MALPFLSKEKNNILARIRSDESTRLRLKYDIYYHAFERQTGTRVQREGQEYVMLSSNDYLGLNRHPKVLEAGRKALTEWGSSTTGARLANGGRSFHIELEEELAEFLGKDACHVYTAGYLACSSAVEGFAQRNDLIFADKNLHSSLWSGIRLSGARCERFSHNNPEHFAEIIADEPESVSKILVLEGVYSMEGHIAKLPGFTKVAKNYDVFIVLDEAHSFGTLGETGRGTASHFGISDEIDVLCGSFSKALASTGGYIASTRENIEYLRSHSKQTIFSASLSPCASACAHASLKIIQKEPEHHQRLKKNLRRYRSILKELEFDTWESETPAIPIVLGDKEKVYFFWKALLDKGVFTVISIAPGVPPNKDLVRTAISAAHTDEDLDQIADALAYAKSKI